MAPPTIETASEHRDIATSAPLDTRRGPTSEQRLQMLINCYIPPPTSNSQVGQTSAAPRDISRQASCRSTAGQSTVYKLMEASTHRACCLVLAARVQTWASLWAAHWPTSTRPWRSRRHRTLSTHTVRLPPSHWPLHEGNAGPAGASPPPDGWWPG